MGTFSSSSIGGPVILPIADCEHTLLCFLGPSIVSQVTAISGSFQRNLASVCNGVSIWKLIMGWIPGYGSLYMVHPLVSAPNFVSVTPYMGVFFNDTATTEIYTLSLHDALPISPIGLQIPLAPWLLSLAPPLGAL